MGYLNLIPFVGWLLALAVSICFAVPFWLVWTVCGIGATYAYFLPTVYHSPGFWDCVGVFTAAFILRAVFLPRLCSLPEWPNFKDQKKPAPPG